MSQFSKVVLQPEMVARDTGPRANSRLSVIYSRKKGGGRRRRRMLTVFRRMETTGDRFERRNFRAKRDSLASFGA